MQLTSAQRMAAFAVIVFALVGLGAFLLLPGSPVRHGGQGSPAGAGRHTAESVASAPTSSVPATPIAAIGGDVNIYRWLPFSKAGLASAAAVVRSFAADYATYTYTENSAAYVARMRGLITQQLAVTLARGYATPGVAQVRIGQKQSAVGSGQITALRAFGPSSVTFLVTVTQKVTSSRGTSSLTSNYAVTVTGAGTQWQVNDIELATAGNT
ncbi:MAG TPA: hypothetical protein VIV12_25055 [Streptosporangiaceae bacterium]